MATVYNIIVGGDNNFTAVYADLNSAIGVGKLYIASLSAFSIIDLKNKKLIDYYTITHAGAANETLEQNDIVDINI